MHAQEIVEENKLGFWESHSQFSAVGSFGKTAKAYKFNMQIPIAKPSNITALPHF